MQLILTHINSQLPAYIWYNFQNLRIWNPNLNIKIICHEQHQTIEDKEKLREHKIELIPCEDIIDDLWQEFLKVSWYHVWGTPDTRYPSPPKFVQGTSERLYALNAYCKKENLSDIFHIENDVMVYENLNKLLPIIKSYYSKMVITPMADKDHTFAFVHIPSWQELEKFCIYNLDQLKLGNDHLVKKYNLDMVHEMSIVKLYKDLLDEVEFFPILPHGPYSLNFDKFNSIFDPASWGQYIGGTNNHGNNIGYAGSHHIIGREILSGKMGARFNGKFPETNTNIKINSLHVHSKQLEKYITK
jgi:hypothetical protein